MKRYIYILCFILSLFIYTGCQDDFDELNDTDQRHICFVFNTDSLFDNVLHYGDEFYADGSNVISKDYSLRITSYCYDTQNKIVYKDAFLTGQSDNKYVKIRHLFKDNTYRFVFVADVVKKDPYVDYYETWFQMGTSSWSDFYFYSDSRSDNAVNNVLGYQTFEMQPDNQTIGVSFNSITYNGFCIFRNLNSIDRLSGYVSYCNSFRLKTLSWLRRSSLAYEFDYRDVTDSLIVKPVSLSCSDSIITVKIRTIRLLGIDSVIIDIRNKGYRPFVATFDCEELRLDDCVFY